MSGNYQVHFEQPGYYESLRSIRRARRDALKLLEALEAREAEVYQDRCRVNLSAELITQARSLHDRFCARHHMVQPDHSLPNQCGLHVGERWDHVLQCAYPYDDLSCDDQWHWIKMAAEMSAASA
jgi:hypothetical protein